MGKSWDSTGITFQAETWATLAEVLHPGAFLMVFAGSRGWHRLACAMEDANLILQPTIFVWLNAQSFPKASRICKAPKPERERRYRWLGWLGRLGNWLLRKKGEPPRYYLDFVWEGHRYGGQILKDCASPILVAQKPSTKPRLDCIVKTGAGAINVDAGRIATGDSLTRNCLGLASAEHDGWKRPWHESAQKKEWGSVNGRWPPNFALIHRAPNPDGSGGCVRAGTRRIFQPKEKRKTPIRSNRSNEAEGNEHIAYGRYQDCETTGYADPDGYERVDAWRCEPDCPARRLGEMSGESKSSIPSNPVATRRTPSSAISDSGKGRVGATMPRTGFNDKGTAARYYHQAGWEHERAEMECCGDCPVAKLDEQAGESKSVGGLNPHREPANIMAENENRPYYNYGDEGGRSRYFHQSDWSHEIAERLATEAPVRYCPKSPKRERNEGLGGFFWRKDKASPTGFVRITEEEWEALGEEEQRLKAETGKRVSLRARGNVHVAIKPISLCIWLARLLAPPKEYAPRRMVIPFCGTFSEGVGAIRSGEWEEVVGIDFIKDHVDMSEARAAFWSAQPRQLELDT